MKLIDYYDLVDRRTHDGTSCDFAALISDLDLGVSTDSDDGGQWRQGGGRGPAAEAPQAGRTRRLRQSARPARQQVGPVRLQLQHPLHRYDRVIQFEVRCRDQ